VLDAEWVDEAKRAVAADFLDYVRGKGPQQRFADAAFRGFDGKAGARITQAEGMLPAEPQAVLAPPAPPVLAGVQDSWERLRKRAKVLLVLDVSGSMGEQVGSREPASSTSPSAPAASGRRPAGRRRPGLALDVLDRPAGGPAVPGARAVRARQAAQPAVKSTIADLVPGGGTGLYATVRAATRSLSGAFDPSRINAVVVLTDGRNEYPADNNIASLTRELGGEDVERSVAVFPIAYGDDADLGELTQIADASRAAAYDASDPASLDKVLTAVLSNF
jgi:Ca-activated chloride channel family protein